MSLILDIIIAFIIDLIIGDPEYNFHPVRIIGKQIYFFEKLFRRFFNNQFLNGILFSIFIIIIVAAEVLIVFFLAGIIDFFLKVNIFIHIVNIFFIYSSVCLSDLKKKGMEIYNLLKINNIKAAGKKLAMIVGRDTDKLDEKQIIRAVVETISENIVDGIISPLFYALIGGGILAVIYRTVNTLDSMVGYKNEKYIYFGKSGARIDDCANFIPARITGIIIPFAGFFCFKSVYHSFRIMLRDGKKHPSPNSGISESSVAGALGIQLGGVSYYGGKKSNKPLIGDNKNSLNKIHIKESIVIAYLTSIIFLFLGVLMRYVIFKILKLWTLK